MKVFRYELGHPHYTTVTVGEVIAKLQEFPADMPVLATWEGICVDIELDCFEVKQGFHGGCPEDACDTLLIDVDQW